METSNPKVHYDATPAGIADRNSRYVERLARATLRELESEYLAAVEDGSESEMPSHRKFCETVATMAEAIAIYRFGSEWVRP